jgi:broad specificity phosphatase PhoE
MMLIIRHGDKEYHNNSKVKSCRLDADLSKSGVITARKVFKSYLQQYKLPSKIISSPYLRARRTASIAQEIILAETGYLIPVEIDILLSEYLGNQYAIKEEDFTIFTKELSVIINENENDLRQRMKAFLENVKLTSEYIWVITHGFNIFTINEILNIDLKYPKPLDAQVINL